jgi:hypothetical protein
MKTHILCIITFFFSKIVLFMRYVEKYCGARGAKNEVTIWRLRVACWISKATCTQAHAHAHEPGQTHVSVSAHTQTHTHTRIRKNM